MSYDLILKGGHVIDPSQGLDRVADVAFAGGKVAAVGENIAPGDSVHVRDVSGTIVAPGFIDLHTHVYWGGTSLGVDAGKIARKSGVTTFVDAGSAGAGNFPGFLKHVIEPSEPRILAYLHVSFAGIFAFSKHIMVGESADLRLMSPADAVAVASANREVIVGIKVRVGRNASGASGAAPLEIALQVAEELSLPLMAHIDEPPPSYEDVLERLRPGDVLTHCFRPFPNTPITGQGAVKPAVLAARARGVLFDVGHGMGSLAFKTARSMLAAGFVPDTISSDLHALNVDGPVFDQATTLSKFLCLGLSLTDVIRATTVNAATAMRRPELGNLQPGSEGDATVFEVKEGRFDYVELGRRSAARRQADHQPRRGAWGPLVRKMTRASPLRERLGVCLRELMLVPGLSGYEGRVRRHLSGALAELGIESHSDRLGNLIATLEGARGAPSVMLFAHMDQLGFVVRKIKSDGLVRIERLGGVPEKALPSQAVLFCVGDGRDVPGVIANKSHHATAPEEKYRVLPYSELYIDAGYDSGEAVRAAGIDIGSPAVYQPRSLALAGSRIAGTAVDDRAGCAVIVEVARALKSVRRRPTVHFVFSVQEEFNLRGALPAAQALSPDVAIQLDLILATDTPDMTERGDVRLGGGPAMSMYSFHGRGTLNGTIPHPALVALFESTAKAERLPLQRSAHIGALTDSSYVQLVGKGVASIDLGFPMRYSHSSLEVCDLADLEQLVRLLVAALPRIDQKFSLDRDDFIQ